MSQRCGSFDKQVQQFLLSAFYCVAFLQTLDGVSVFRQLSFSYFHYRVHQFHLPLLCSTFVKFFQTFSKSIPASHSYLFALQLLRHTPTAIRMERPISLRLATSENPPRMSAVALGDQPCCSAAAVKSQQRERLAYRDSFYCTTLCPTAH